MSMTFNVKSDIKAMTKDLSRVQKTIVPQTTARALNIAARAVQTQAVRAIAKDMGLKNRDVKRYLILRKATWKNLLSSVTANRRKRVAVHLLRARQTKGGVTYRGQGGGRRLIPGAFMPSTHGGRPGAFKRAGKKRTPVLFLRTVSINYVFVRDHVIRAMDAIARPRFIKEFQSDLKHRLAKKGLG